MFSFNAIFLLIVYISYCFTIVFITCFFFPPDLFVLVSFMAFLSLVCSYTFYSLYFVSASTVTFYVTFYRLKDIYASIILVVYLSFLFSNLRCFVLLHILFLIILIVIANLRTIKGLFPFTIIQ